MPFKCFSLSWALFLDPSPVQLQLSFQLSLKLPLKLSLKLSLDLKEPLGPTPKLKQKLQ